MSVHYEPDHVARITIDRPDTRNALGPVEWGRLLEAVTSAGADPTVRALILRGGGGAFCAGGDLKTMPERLAQPPAERRAKLLADFQLVRAMRELPKPIIAAIDGPCLGAGLALALACDLRVATRRATFGAVFHRLGLTGDFGVLQLLPRTIGPARALELLLLADVIDAARAEAIGLVHRLTEPDRLDDEVAALALRLADGPPLALAFTKAGVQRAYDHELAAALEYEAMAQAIVSRSDDAQEGLRALAEKRPPKFSGR